MKNLRKKINDAVREKGNRLVPRLGDRLTEDVNYKHIGALSMVALSPLISRDFVEFAVCASLGGAVGYLVGGVIDTLAEQNKSNYQTQ